MKPWALVPVLVAAAASHVHAQPLGTGAPRVWHLGFSAVASTNTAGLESAPCDNPQGQLGDFCGNAGGTGAGLTLSFGRTVSRRASFELEAAVATTRTGKATYYRYAGHFATNRTDATYTHREQFFSALFRFHPGRRGRRPSIEPVVGATLAHGADALTSQTQTLVNSSVNFRRTTRPEDVSTSRWALGVTGGADVLLASNRRAAFALTARLRLVGWERVASSEMPGNLLGPRLVPAAVGRLTLQLGAGIRWGGPN
jgi:hypothetical protein